MAVHGTLAVFTAFILPSISTIVIALRFYSRYFLVGKLSSPDWLMLTALILSWSITVINYYQVIYLDYSKAYYDKQNWIDTVKGSLLTLWIYRLFYIVSLCLIKTSILIFYHYIAAANKCFRILVKILMFVVIAGSIGMFIAAVLTCRKPSDSFSFQVFFNAFYGIYAKHCYNPIIFWVFSAIFNLVTDTIIWIMPIPFVLNLRTMSARRRIELAGIFSVGLFAIAASAGRLYVVSQWVSSWIKEGERMGDLLIWGQVEQHAGIISASIPFLRPIARKVFRIRRRHEHPPPSPAAKLIAPQFASNESNPLQPRTPIIPSPSPTFGSQNEPFKVPNSPLSPIAPIHSGLEILGGRVPATV